MSKLDLLLTAIVVALMVLGFMSGLLRAAVRMVAGALALGLSVLLSNPLGHSLAHSFPAVGVTIYPIVNTLLFVVCLFGTLVLGNLLHNVAEDNNFGAVNRVLGVALGAFKGLALAYVVLGMLYLLPSTAYFDQVKADSQYYKIYVEKGYQGFGTAPKSTVQSSSSSFDPNAIDPADPFGKK